MLSVEASLVPEEKVWAYLRNGSKVVLPQASD